MDISAIDSAVGSAADAALVPEIKLENLSSLDSINGLAGTQTASAIADMGEFGASTVTLSPLAQLLEATIAFQLQQAAQSHSTSENSFISDFMGLATTTNLFINAFNNFQTSTTNDVASEFDNALNNALLMALQPQNTKGSTVTGQTFLESLAAIGITFRITVNSADQFQVSWTKLEAAFNANPLQTSMLIANAFQAISEIEKNLTLSPSSDEQYMFATNFGLSNETAMQALNEQAVNEQTITAATQSALANDALLTILNGTAVTPESAMTSAALAMNPAAAVAGAANSAATTNAATQTTSTAIADATTNATVNANGTSTAGTQGTVASTVAPAGQAVATAAATSATPAVAAGAGNPVATGVVTTSVTGPDQTDPFVAAAIAAYRVNEVVVDTESEPQAAPVAEIIPDVSNVTKADAVALDAHGDADSNGRNRMLSAIHQRNQK